MNVDDYGAYPTPASGLDAAAFGAVCAVPLTSDGEVLGLIGLASGDRARPFTRARARGAVPVRPAGVDRPRQRPPVRASADGGPQRAHAALHDMLTGLPNRTLLLNRLAEHLDADARDRRPRRPRRGWR